MFENNEIVRSLYQLTEYPPDWSHPIYREYPFYKLGVKQSVQYFSERLTPLAEEIITANPGYSNWVLTSPACHRIPTAANLLCQDIYERMKRQSPTSRHISLVKLFNLSDNDDIYENSKDFSDYNNYSKYTWEERLKITRRYRFIIKEEDFRTRGIIFINDINVTGSSQEYISHVFSEVYPGKINWLYIIDCDKTVGRTDPQLEYEINSFNIKTVSDFAAILSRDDIQHTAKCLSKLFYYTIEELDQLLAILDPHHASRLWDSIQREDFYQGNLFREKMALLRAHC